MYVFRRPSVPAAVLALLYFAAPAVDAVYSAPKKYLLVSNAESGTIAYTKVPDLGKYPPPAPLVSQGLGHPQGLAVDQRRQLLFVADSDKKQVLSYGLSVGSDGALSVDEQTPVMDNVEARWVAVDGSGNVYATDERNQRILKVTQKQILDGDTTAKVVYSATGLKPVPNSELYSPGGIATDNLYLYWSNKRDPSDTSQARPRAVVRHRLLPGNATQAALAVDDSSLKVYGVCLAVDNVFYTDAETNLYVAKRTGGPKVVASAAFRNPRGCAWDGDDTVYVADRTLGAVYSVPGPMASLAQVSASKVVDFQNAFGVAVFATGSGWRSATLSTLTAALTAAVVLSLNLVV